MISRNRILLALILILSVITVSVLGYHYYLGWPFSESLYMTFLILTTVGFKEVHDLNATGRYFTIFVMVIGFLTMGYTATTLVSWIFEGQIIRIMKERRMRLFARKLKNHHIICGFGDVGKEAAAELQNKRVPFLVIDKGLDQLEKDAWPKITFVTGDATDEAVLSEAGISSARSLITCLPEDQQNVFVVLTARQMNPSLVIVSQVSDARNTTKLEKAGANRVIHPKQIAGRRLASMSLHPSVVNFLDILSSGGDESIRIEAFCVSGDSALVGQSLKESNIGRCTGAIIIGIMDSRGKTRLNSSTRAELADLRLSAGDELIALGSEEQLASLVRFIRTGG